MLVTVIRMVIKIKNIGNFMFVFEEAERKEERNSPLAYQTSFVECGLNALLPVKI